jgi:hypothetical protein
MILSDLLFAITLALSSEGIFGLLASTVVKEEGVVGEGEACEVTTSGASSLAKLRLKHRRTKP